MSLETNRRNFLKLMGIGATLAVVPPILIQPIIDEELEFSPSIPKGLGFNIRYKGQWKNVGDIISLQLPASGIDEFNVIPFTGRYNISNVFQLEILQNPEQAYLLNLMQDDWHTGAMLSRMSVQVSLEIHEQKFSLESHDTLITDIGYLELSQSYPSRTIEIRPKTFILT